MNINSSFLSGYLISIDTGSKCNRKLRLHLARRLKIEFVSFGKKKGTYSLNISKYDSKKQNCIYMNDNGCIYRMY